MSMGVFHPQDLAEGPSSGPRAPFGYQKSASKRSQLVPDPIAAITVRKIFELTANDMGVTAIVRYLNEKEIPTPIQYARSNVLTGNYDDGDGSWNSRSVKYILTNRTYTGMLIQGKEKRAVAGTHDALVDKNTFEAIQNEYRDFYFCLCKFWREKVAPKIHANLIYPYLYPLQLFFTPLRPARHNNFAYAPPCPSSSSQRYGHTRSA